MRIAIASLLAAALCGLVLWLAGRSDDDAARGLQPAEDARGAHAAAAGAGAAVPAGAGPPGTDRLRDVPFEDGGAASAGAAAGAVAVELDEWGLPPGVEATRRGHVIDPDGEPVARAELRVRGRDAEGRGAWTRARTTAAGKFGLVDPPLFDVELEVRHPEFRTLRRTFAALDELPEPIVLEPGARLRLSVTVEGAPMPARVRYLLEGRGGVDRSAQRGMVDLTPGDGGARVADILGLAPGQYLLRVDAEGLPPSEDLTVDLEESGVTEVPVRLVADGPPGVLRAVDEGGAPVSGARVAILELRAQGAQTAEAGRTDADGRWSSFRLRAGAQIRVEVRAEGYSPAVLTPDDLLAQLGLPDESGDAAAPAPELVAVLGPEAAFEVLVVDAEGLGVAGVDVFVLQRAVEHRISSTARTGADGRVRIGGLGDGRFVLSFALDGENLGREERALADGEEQEVVFELPAVRDVRGTVRINGRPAAGGLVTLRLGALYRQADVDEHGRFVLPIPEGGRAEFGYQLARGLRFTDVRPVEPGEEVELDFEAYRVTGRVAAADGEPFPGLEGGLVSSAGRLQFTTDGDGRFELEAVPVGVYRWTVNGLPPGALVAGETVRIAGREHLELEVLTTTGLPVRVEGVPGGWPVEFYWIAADGRAQRLAQSPDGELVDWPLRPGLGFATARGYVNQYFRVDDPDDSRGIVVQFEPAGFLEVVIRSSDGGPLPGHPYHLTPLDGPPLHPRLRAGRAGGRSLGLPAGSFRVEADVPGVGRLQAEVDIVVGEPTRVELAP